jgi:hypothetical protein
MKKFKGDPIEFMPNYPAGDWHRVVEFFQSFYSGTMEKARERADRERKTLFADREKSRIRFDEDNQCWRGRKTKPAYEKFGKRRPGDNPDSLRNVLIREVGKAYLTTDELQTILEDVYGDEWKSKFSQARTKHILVRNKTFGVWHLWTTQPPTHATDGMTIGNRRTYYAEVYADMDGLRHDSDPEKSEVLAFLLSRQARNDLTWAQEEFRTARQCGAFKFAHEKGFEASRGFWSVIKTNQPQVIAEEPGEPVESEDSAEPEEPELTLTDEMREFIAEQPWMVKRLFWQAIADKFDLGWKEVRDHIFLEAEEEDLVVAHNTVRIRPANMTGLEYCGISAYESWKRTYLTEEEERRQAEDERREREAEAKRLAEELRAKQEAEAQALRDQIKAQEKAERERQSAEAAEAKLLEREADPAWQAWEAKRQANIKRIDEWAATVRIRPQEALVE